jgi:hypothetical protein
MRLYLSAVRRVPHFSRPLREVGLFAGPFPQAEGVVEIESQWTARKRELLGVVPQITGSQIPRPVPAQNAGTRTGHPQD